MEVGVNSLVVQVVKNLPAMQILAMTRFNPWVGKIPWRREWQPTPVFLAWRIPMTEETGGLQFMSCKELDTTEQLIFSRKLVAGRPRVRNEVAAIEDPVPFLGLREADLEGGWALAEDLHGKQRGRLEGPLNYSARVR